MCVCVYTLKLWYIDHVTINIHNFKKKLLENAYGGY